MLFTPSALWTIANLQLPILKLVWNNRSYHNSRQHADRVARHRGRDMARPGRGIEIQGPEIDFAGLARVYGLWGIGPATDSADLGAVLKRAVAEVRRGQPALADVVTQAS